MERTKDYVQQLANYIKKNLSKGYTLESLRFSLIGQGYSRLSVDNAIEIANKQMASEIPPIKEIPQIIYKTIPEIKEKENFLERFFKKLFGK